MDTVTDKMYLDAIGTNNVVDSIVYTIRNRGGEPTSLSLIADDWELAKSQLQATYITEEIRRIIVGWRTKK